MLDMGVLLRTACVGTPSSPRWNKGLDKWVWEGSVASLKGASRRCLCLPIVVFFLFKSQLMSFLEGGSTVLQAGRGCACVGGFPFAGTFTMLRGLCFHVRICLLELIIVVFYTAPLIYNFKVKEQRCTCSRFSAFKHLFWCFFVDAFMAFLYLQVMLKNTSSLFSDVTSPRSHHWWVQFAGLLHILSTGEIKVLPQPEKLKNSSGYQLERAFSEWVRCT